MSQAEQYAQTLTAVQKALCTLDAHVCNPALAVQIAALKKNMDAAAEDAVSGKSVAKTVIHCREDLEEHQATALVEAMRVVVHNRKTVQTIHPTPRFWDVQPSDSSNAVILGGDFCDSSEGIGQIITQKELEQQRPGADDADAKLGEHVTQLAGMQFTGIGSFLAHDPAQMYLSHWPVSAEGGWEASGMDQIVARDGSMTEAEAEAEAAKLQGAARKLQEAVAALHSDRQNMHKCLMGETTVPATDFVLQQVQRFGTGPLDGLLDKTKALLQGACLSLDDNMMGEHGDDDVDALIKKREEDIAAPERREDEGNALSTEEHEKANADAKTSGRAVCDMLKKKLKHVELAVRVVEDRLQKSLSSESDVRQAPASKANAEWLAGESTKMQQVMANMRTNLEQWLGLHESMREADDAVIRKIQAQMDTVLADMTDITGDPCDPDSKCGSEHSRSWGGTCAQQRDLVVQHAELETEKNFKIAGQELKDAIKAELESKVARFTAVLTRSDEMVQNTLAKLDDVSEALDTVREACTRALEKRLGELKARRDWLTRQFYTNTSVLRHHIATCYIIDAETRLVDAEQELLEAERKCRLACRNKSARNADKRKAAKDAVAAAKAEVRDCQTCAADARAELTAVDTHFEVDDLARVMQARKLEPLSTAEDRFHVYDIERLVKEALWAYAEEIGAINGEYEERQGKLLSKHKLLTDGCGCSSGSNGTDGGGGDHMNARTGAWSKIGSALFQRSTRQAGGEGSSSGNIKAAGKQAAAAC